jgi:hypothetical protein
MPITNNDQVDSNAESNTFELDPHQIEIIQQGEADIRNGDFLSQAELDKSDLKIWLEI